MCSRHLTTPNVLLPSPPPSLSLFLSSSIWPDLSLLAPPSLSHLAATEQVYRSRQGSRQQLNPGLHLSTPGRGVCCYLALFEFKQALLTCQLGLNVDNAVTVYMQSTNYREFQIMTKVLGPYEPLQQLLRSLAQILQMSAVPQEGWTQGIQNIFPHLVFWWWSKQSTISHRCSIGWLHRAIAYCMTEFKSVQFIQV